MLKNKQYQILKELMSLEVINPQLCQQVSDNIEMIFHNESKLKTDEWIHLTQYMKTNNQLMVALADSPDARQDVRKRIREEQVLGGPVG